LSVKAFSRSSRRKYYYKLGNKKLEDHMEQDSNLPQENQGAEDLSLGDDDAIALMDAPDDMLEGEDQGEDIIELTDLAEEPPDEEAGLDGNETQPDALDAEALEEEEIIELVDAVEDESEADEGILDLTDMVEDEASQAEETPIEASPAEIETDEGLVEDMGIVPGEETAEMPAEEEDMADSEPSVEMAEIAIEEASEADETVEQEALAPEAIEPYESPTESTGLDAEDAVREKLSDEKIEAIITKVVEDAVAEKADRILLEVAESAIAREIEKIKKAL
jgi:hypothetical protein